MNKRMPYSFFVLIIIFGLFSFSSCSENKPVCDLEPDPGFCNAAFPRYYFNNSTKKCEEFTWGGCDGVVPFETKQDCEACGCH